MNRYKQEYVTEFAYILGTMQKETGNIIDKFPPKLTENQEGIKIFNDFVIFMVDKFLSNTERDYEKFIRDNIEDIKKEFTDNNRFNKMKDIKSIAVYEYEELTNLQKNHLTDFEILSAIDSCVDVDIKTKEALLNIIVDVWLKDENHISASKIADEIVEAYRDKKVTLKSLQDARSRDILLCVYGDEDFEELNKENLEEDELIENLFERACDTEYRNQEKDIIVVEEGIVIGSTSEILEYLKEENEYLTNNEKECSEAIIRNNETVIKEIKEDKLEDEIIGIEWDKEYGIYNVIDNEKIIERLEEILEEQEEEEELD